MVATCSSHEIKNLREEKTMTTKAELVRLYTSMVDDGEGEMLYPEISECTRLKELYEERLKYLLERNPILALVREGAVHLFGHYEAHFRMKIRENELGVEAATEVLNKWQTEEPDSKKSTMMWGDLVFKLLGSQ